jgi:hypothetical protein
MNDALRKLMTLFTLVASTCATENMTATGGGSCMSAATGGLECNCPPGASCAFSGKDRASFLAFTFNIFPKATATIDCVSAKCGAINVQSAGATKVTCGQGSCNAAMFQGSNITVDCTTKNSCNAISCKGQDIVTNCDFNPKKYVSSKCRGIAPPNPCFS